MKSTSSRTSIFSLQLLYFRSKLKIQVKVLTSRPTWIIYLDGDTLEKPSYMFTKKILRGFQEPVFILIVDNTPKALTKYY